ncbi:LysR family transcriptional regulator [Fusibacter tunisiensis]|uniref:DNA-binding transcriptional LysR family regulator n=1 Tax=Fusibacter tunisiensis TaxID=1008308 RepID=A0ABS2MSF9_9FIRM|nr:LysR family transcriptional regulator [Fusibacter tunisiensis]MBM7562350.1 DNA-binding transcriptional LysR family regulator [Fusibacter tunisiensis]
MQTETNKQHTSINFELYKFFYHSAHDLNFSKAANTLHVTQSAVSQAIKSLETQLGVNLFFRQGRNIKLTFEGEVLYKHIEKAYNFIRSAENAIHSIKSLDEGTIFIGASDTITRYYLIPKIKMFHALYPKVRISISNRPSPKSVERLKNGEIDIAVINTNPKCSYEGLSVSPFSSIENLFICSGFRKDIYSRTHTLKELTQYPIICLEENSTTRRVLNAYYADHKLELEPAFEFGSLDVILESVKADMGIGFVTQNIAELALKKESVCRIPVVESIPAITVSVLTNTSKPLSLAAQKFLDLLIAKHD